MLLGINDFKKTTVIDDMCGITGYISESGNAERLKMMANAIKHRGPDADGFYNEEIYPGRFLGLAHRRLSILDLSEAANQPFISADGRYIIVYNGEVYNYRELADLYQIHTRTTCDTEVILELFVKLGSSAFSLLNGMFALAIWDVKDQELILARDRFGIKPLFYFYDGKELVFGSEIKAIKAGNPSDLEIESERFGSFFNLGFIPTPNSIYKNLKKLKPGHLLRFNRSGIKEEVFYELKQSFETKTYDNIDLATDKLNELLLKSVERQLVSDVPLGVFLSGGTDSSLITALMKQISSGTINTFSVGFKDSNFDELPYAAKISKYLGTNHHELIVTDEDMLKGLYRIMDSYDEPYVIASGFPSFAISELTRNYVTVALSGEGADEIFMGYGFHIWADRLSRFPLNLASNIASGLMAIGNNFRLQQKSKLFRKPIAGSFQNHIFSQEQFYFSHRELKNEFDPRLFHTASDQLEISFPELRHLDPVEKQAWFDVNVYLVDDLLVKVDRASMFHSLEVRVPFLDNDFFDFAVNIKRQFKLEGTSSKKILKNILYKYIPSAYFERKKWGFAPPLSKWMKNELKGIVETSLSRGSINNAGFVRYEYVKELKKEYESGNSRIYNKLWLLTLAHIWLEKNK